MAWGATEWTATAAVVTVVITGLASTITAVFTAVTYRREQNQRDWSRLQELVAVLYNNDAAHGRWAQMAAIGELSKLASRRPEIRKIASEAAEHWKREAPSSPLIADLEALAVDEREKKGLRSPPHINQNRDIKSDA